MKTAYTQEEFREYIGDGVYALFDGYHIWLTTLEGNRIALEPPVLDRLVEYRARLEKTLRERAKKEGE